MSESIESFYIEMRKYIDIDILDMIFSPFDKMFIDSSIVFKEMFGDNIIFDIIGFDEKDKLRYSNELSNYKYSLGFYKSITLFIIYYTFQLLNYI